MLVLTYSIFFGGAELVYSATIGSYRNNKLREKYLDTGIRVDGHVEKISTDCQIGCYDGCCTARQVQNATVSYNGPNGRRYRMNISPLDERTRNSIVARGVLGEESTIPIIVLRGTPNSGIPATYVENYDSMHIGKKVSYLFLGIGIAGFVNIMFVIWDLGIPFGQIHSDNDVYNPWGEYSISTMILDSATRLFALELAVVFFRPRWHPYLTYSEKMEEGDWLVLPDDQMLQTNENTPLVPPLAVSVGTADCVPVAVPIRDDDALAGSKEITVQATIV